MNALHACAQADWAAALLDPELACPPGLRAWNGHDVGRRFAVHRNNVVASLVDALADSFPVVQALVGEEFFRATAAVFVRQHPPRSVLMQHYGSEFAGFLEGFAPAQALPYLADVARLEWARVEACHAADAPPLGVEAAAMVSGGADRVGRLLLGLHPALRLVSSPCAVASLWAAHNGEGRLEDVDPWRGEHALVLRPAFDVLVLRCDSGTASFTRALQQGRNLADSAAAGAACDGFDLAATLSLLLVHGGLAAICFPEAPCT